MFTYSTRGPVQDRFSSTSRADNKLHNVRFIGGCGGNLQGIARLVEGKNIDDIQALLAGIRCRNGTSCPDQLAKAIAEYKAEKEAAAAQKP